MRANLFMDGSDRAWRGFRICVPSSIPPPFEAGRRVELAHGETTGGGAYAAAFARRPSSLRGWGIAPCSAPMVKPASLHAGKSYGRTTPPNPPSSARSDSRNTSALAGSRTHEGYGLVHGQCVKALALFGLQQRSARRSLLLKTAAGVASFVARGLQRPGVSSSRVGVWRCVRLANADCVLRKDPAVEPVSPRHGNGEEIAAEEPRLRELVLVLGEGFRTRNTAIFRREIDINGLRRLYAS